MFGDPTAVGAITAEQLVLGSVLLELVSDWDSWVSRRVDKFYFEGDDERVLHRHQSIDFEVPESLWDIDLPLLRELGGFPVPITFVRKWRLPQFSLRDSSAGAVSLLQREQSVPLAAAMLIALGTVVKGKGLGFESEDDVEMPPALRARLAAIPSGERTESLMRCTHLSEPPNYPQDPEENEETTAWRQALLGNETFMSLAYELAGGFLLMATVPNTERESTRQILKFSYNSYVVAPGRDPRGTRGRHLLRRIHNLSRDAVDPVRWKRSSSRRRYGSRPSDPGETGRLVLSTLCDRAPGGLNLPGSSLACALVTIRGPERAGRPSPVEMYRRHRERQVIRLRPSGVVTMDGLPPGRYTLEANPQSGYRMDQDELSFTIERGAVTRVHMRTRRVRLAGRVTKAPPVISSPAPRTTAINRGVGWRSKPLAIRVRSGEGGSYHCEFEAPPGLHITRARLISNLEGNADEETEDGERKVRPHDVDMVLRSAQRAHLYARATRETPATGYALLNLRPRIETIVRPSLITAIGVVLVLAFLSIGLSHDLFDGLGDEDGDLLHDLFGALGGQGGEVVELPWALVALLLAGPGALATFVVQAVPSRVTNAMLWGLRVLAMVPTALSLGAIGVLLLDGDGPSADAPLWIAFVFAVICTAVIFSVNRVAEHPPEQRPTDYRQGRDFEKRYAAENFEQNGEGQMEPRPQKGYVAEDGSSPAAIRDRMLERIGGMTDATRRAALGEGWFRRWEVEVPPALYFDSAESPAVFLGLPDEQLADLRSGVRSLLKNAADGRPVAS